MLLEQARLPTHMPDSRGKITLEELLRAKRNEQPEPEFWKRFEREFKGKQKLLIQSQLVSESGLKSLFATRLYKVGTFTATCGIAAIAVYLGFQTPVGKQTVAQTETTDVQTPRFSVATTTQPAAKQETPAGLQEFATLAQYRAPRVVVREPVAIAQAPSPAQLSALKTLAALEDTIQAKRASGPASTPAYQFVSSNGLFEEELTNVQDEELEDVWDFENASLLGKYADPLTGSFNSSSGNLSLNDIQHVSFSQLDEVISSQSSRSSRSLDALNVRF